MLTRIFPFIAFVFFFLAFCLTSMAQVPNEFEKKDILNRAEMVIKDFEYLLGFISDPTRSRGAINSAIASSYTEVEGPVNRIFFNEEVIIEDDISLIDLSKDVVSQLTVPAYLEKFKLEYEPSYDNTIFFSDLTLSELREEDFIYIIARYTSEFKGKNKYNQEVKYRPIKRSATLRVYFDYDEDRWQVLIAGVNYDREVYQNVIRPTAQENQPLKNTKKDEDQALTVIGKETEASDSKPVEDKEALPPLEFANNFPDKIKKGNPLQLNWNNSVENATVSLFKGDTKVKDLRQELYGKQWNWKVDQKPGKNYNIRLLEPGSGRDLVSSRFTIRSSVPLVVKVGIPVAVVGYFAAAYMLNLPPFPDDESTTDLPAPPAFP